MPVIDRDEAHFAQASRQMIQSGNYFQIRFQDRTRFQKPPGINWLQAAAVKLFSNPDASSIWPYRLPSLFGALISILLTYFFACRFMPESSALLAAGLLACTLLLTVEAHMAVIDASLLSSVLLMQGALWVIYQEAMAKRQAHWLWALCFWLAMSYGLVLKGVTPLVGGLSVVALCLGERRIDWLRGLHVFSGLLVFSLLSLAWILLVNQAEHSNYLMQMIHKDLLPKLQGGHESHGKPPLFHLMILPLTFWPASLFLWQGGVFAYRQRHSQIIKFLLAWILPTWIFFELMPTKLPQYVLPTFPAIALLCSLAITKADRLEMPGKWLGLLQVLWGLLSIGLALVLAILPYLLMGQWTGAGLILGLEISVLTLVAVHSARRGLYLSASKFVLLLALISYPLIFNGLLPQLKPLWLTANLTKLIDKNKISHEKPLLAVGFDEPSLVFYLNTTQVQFVNRLIAEKIIQSDHSRIAIIKSADLKAWTEDAINLSILGQTKGFNYSKGRWLELLIVGGKNEKN